VVPWDGNQRIDGPTHPFWKYLERVSSPLGKSIHRVVDASLASHERVVLAISGGLDSMVLLDAAARVRDAGRLVVSTFDHGTGAPATAACALVRGVAGAHGIECVSARGGSIGHSEARWREARWTFLRDVARSHAAPIVTAHTADDQIETVLMRAMRGAGARGLAGLLATSDVLRPLLVFRRADLLNYARERAVEWVEDPTNVSRRFLRNRVRHDILPALRRANPRIDHELIDIGQRAADWRRETEALAPAVSRVDGDAVDVVLASIDGLAANQLAVLLPAVAAQVGATLDRRGISRVSAFAGGSRVGSRMQLSGGWEVVRSRRTLRLQPSARAPEAEAVLSASSATTWGGWTFWAAEAKPGVSSVVSNGSARQSDWDATLPVDQPLRIREWRAGDRLMGASGGPGRKVKRLLNDAGVTGHERDGWPVVLWGERIVWIPGVRRSSAATVRSGRPSLAFFCARHSG